MQERWDAISAKLAVEGDLNALARRERSQGRVYVIHATRIGSRLKRLNRGIVTRLSPPHSHGVLVHNLNCTPFQRRLSYGRPLVVRGTFETVDEVEARNFGRRVNRLWALGETRQRRALRVLSHSRAPPLVSKPTVYGVFTLAAAADAPPLF